MDIAQNARKVVFCGTFDTKGSVVEVGGGTLRVIKPGAVRKLVRQVEQVTYSGAQALKLGHKAVFVTERAVFDLTSEGMVLTEVAPGIDLRRDVLDLMEFEPLIPRDPIVMSSALFSD